MANKRYDRSSPESAVMAALKVIGDRPLYVAATAYGYTVEPTPPPFNQAHYRVNPDKTLVFWIRDCVTGNVTESPMSYSIG